MASLMIFIGFWKPRLLLPEFWERPTAVAAVAAANRAMKGLLCAGDGQLHISCLTWKTRRVGWTGFARQLRLSSST